MWVELNSRITDVSKGRQIALLKYGLDNSVLSGDGTRLLVWANEPFSSSAWVYDAGTGARIVTLAGHKGVVAGGAFSADGTRVVTRSAPINDSEGDNTARVWNVSDGHLIATLTHSGGVASAMFSPDGAKVLTASKDASIWDAKSGQHLLTLPIPESRASYAAFSPDGTHVLVSFVGMVTESAGDATHIFDASNGREVAKVAGAAGQTYREGTGFTPDGMHVVTCCTEQPGKRAETNVMWSVGGVQITTWKGSAAVSPDGSRVLTWEDARRAVIANANNGDRLATMTGFGGDVTAAAFSADGKYIAVGLRDGSVRLWDSVSVREVASYQGLRGGVSSIAFSSDGSRIIAGSEGDTARIWAIDSTLLETSAELVSRICATTLSGALSRLTASDLESAPGLSASGDGNACASSNVFSRASILLR